MNISYPFVSLGVVNTLEMVEQTSVILQSLQDVKPLIVFPLQVLILVLTTVKLIQEIKKRKN